MSASVSSLLSTSRKRTRAVFGDEYSSSIDLDEELSHRARLASKIRTEYESVKELPFFIAEKQGKKRAATAPKPVQSDGSIQTKLIADVQRSQRFALKNISLNYSESQPSNALTIRVPTSRPRG